MLFVLVVGLLIWMLGCAYAGFRARFGLFAIILLAGMGLNTLWMVFGLDARPLSNPALTAHAAALLYGISALGFGWLAGRIARRFRETRVDPL